MWNFISTCNRLFFGRAPHFYSETHQENCFPRSHLSEGEMPGARMRTFRNTGPLTCIRECLLRRSCLSISYNTEGSCFLHYVRTSPDNPIYFVTSTVWQYLEKPGINGMVDVHPCNDTICGENERCELLHDKSVFCSITECIKPPTGVFRSWRTYSTSISTIAVGDIGEFYCLHGTSLQVATYKCKQDGSWGITDISLPNIHKCNKRECQKNKDFIYIKETHGCYRFFNESKTHSEAEAYCRTTFRHGHLFLADSSEKINALTHKVINSSRLGYVVLFTWTDGVYHGSRSSGEIDTWQGPVPLEKLRYVKQYANIVFEQQRGCPMLLPVLDEMSLHDCSETYFFVCEIEMDT